MRFRQTRDFCFVHHLQIRSEGRRRLASELLPRPEGREDDVLEGAVLLHRRLELVEGDLAVAVGVHLVEHLVQLPGLRDVARKALLRQGLAIFTS